MDSNLCKQFYIFLVRSVGEVVNRVNKSAVEIWMRVQIFSFAKTWSKLLHFKFMTPLRTPRITMSFVTLTNDGILQPKYPRNYLSSTITTGKTKGPTHTHTCSRGDAAAIRFAERDLTISTCYNIAISQADTLRRISSAVASSHAVSFIIVRSFIGILASVCFCGVLGVLTATHTNNGDAWCRIHYDHWYPLLFIQRKGCVTGMQIIIRCLVCFLS